MNSKMTTKSQLSTTEPKTTTTKNKNKLEQEQNHRNEEYGILLSAFSLSAEMSMLPPTAFIL